MTTLYKTDLVEWAEQQVQLLRAKDFEKVDWLNVIEEIESLGTTQKKALRNWLAILLMYLLKWQYQPAHRSNRWRATINNQRADIDVLLKGSASLRPILYEFIIDAYSVAVRKAASETDLPAATFPSACPYTLEEVMTEDYLPQ